MRCWPGILLVFLCLLVAEGVPRGTGKVPQRGRVLFLAPLSLRSHKNFFMGIAKALAENGKQVTIVSSFKPSKIEENIREVVVEGVGLMELFSNNFDGKLEAVRAMTDAMPELCSKALGLPEVKALLNEEFDIILIPVLQTCFLSFVHRMKVPYIWVTPTAASWFPNHLIGNPSFPSFAGYIFLEAIHPLTFMERAAGAISETLSNSYFSNHIIPRMEEICRRQGLCPEDMPSLYEMQYNASLFLVNSVQTLENPPRPHVPGIVHLGGIHCHPPQPLPKDLEDWIRGAGEDGFIFFSLGSTIASSSFPEKYRQVLVKMFGSLKQRVLWKWDQDTMPDLPPNVRLGKWLPQQDILGHPSLRLFITHGGLLSTLESTFNGVPVLGLPVASDQQTNMVQVELEGWGQAIYWDQLSEETLLKGIYTVMTDHSMKAEARRRSRVMKDQLESPGNVAAFWVEYVIRHNGAPHLRSPILSMAWYQLYNVDVWLTVLAVVFLVNYLLLKLLLALCLRLCCSSKNKKKDKRE